MRWLARGAADLVAVLTARIGDHSANAFKPRLVSFKWAFNAFKKFSAGPGVVRGVYTLRERFRAASLPGGRAVPDSLRSLARATATVNLPHSLALSKKKIGRSVLGGG